jgi:hypothetical protein
MPTDSHWTAMLALARCAELATRAALGARGLKHERMALLAEIAGDARYALRTFGRRATR